MAFTFYNIKPVIVLPTISEIIASLTGGQKGQILNGFAKGTRPIVLARYIGIDQLAVIRLYVKMDEMEEMSRSLMRGEVVITPAVIDPETGEVTIPVVYNTPPSNASGLLSAIQDVFSDDFTSGQVSAVLTKMVEYSKYDGTGDWTYYSSNVIL